MTYVVQTREDYEDALWTDLHYVDVPPALIRRFVESVELGHDPFNVRYRAVEFVPPDAICHRFCAVGKG